MEQDMDRVYISTVMNARLEPAWGLLGAFSALGEWNVPADQEATAFQRAGDNFRTFFECVDERFGTRKP